MLSFLKKHWPVIILFLTSLSICVANYTPHTFLSGWDTLHPEFNFGLNIERVIFGVFRTEQGLGAVAGHSHMSDLPRILLLFIFHFFLPLDFLRYSYIFLTLIAGPIGMYFFLKRIVFKGKSLLPSFLGAMFYLLNLGTMQQFIVAFEMFNALYATLPFLMLFATEYLLSPTQNNKKARRELIFFCIATLLASPMAYAATLWYAYFLLLGIYLFFLILPSLFKRKYLLLKRAAILILVTLTINSFWLLPNLYYVKNHSSDVSNSHINTLFTPQAFLYNKEFGTGADIVLMRSFLFDWGAYTNYNSYDKLLKPWIEHLNNTPVLFIGYGIALVSLLGLIYSVFKKQKIALALFPVTLVTLFFLINENFPISGIYAYLMAKLPLLSEALRFPHSKFYIHFMFVYAVYFALGNALILTMITKLPKIAAKISSGVYVAAFSALLIYFMLPAFQGQLISPYIRINIPDDYFQMSDWFNSQADNRRIAPLPINSFWGWDYYNWYGNQALSYQGAGFLWFNIKQPFLARDFDRWSSYNEGYYNEMAYAVYSQNPTLLKQVINKYQIGYILFDTSNIAPVSDPSVLFYKNIEQMLTDKKSLGIQEVKKIGEHITIYHFKQKTDYVYEIKNPVNVLPAAKTENLDSAYQKYNQYITNPNDTSSSNSVYLPFRNILDSQNKLTLASQISQDGITLQVPNSYSGGNLQADSYLKSEELIPANLFVKRQDNLVQIHLYPFTPTENASSIPIEVNTTLPKTDSDYILSINQNNISFLNSLANNTEYSLGRIFLNTKSDNSVGIYNNKSDLSFYPDFSGLNFSLRPCDAIDRNQLFGIDFLNSEKGFSLSGKNTPICMITPLTDLLPDLKNDKLEEVLLGVNFNFQNIKAADISNSLPNICMANLTTGTCLNYIAKSISSQVSLTNNFSLSFGVKADQLNNLGLKIFFDTTKSNKEQKISYTNFNLSLSKPLFYINFPSSILAKSLASAFKAKLTDQSILIPFSGNTSFNQDLTSLPKTTGLCEDNPLIESGNRSKQIIRSHQEYIRYSSDQGTICDHFSYQDLSQSQGYLLLITGRNISGLPLSICATNYQSKRCDIYASLSQSKEFKTDIFLIPPISDTAHGYDININNLGIKNSPAVNDLQSIQIIPFPYKWLTELETSNTPLTTQAENINSLNFKNLDPLTYLVNDNLSPSSNSVLVLSESYEDGWRAYESSNFLSQALPILFGKELKQHILVNNWENGWVLDNNSIKQSDTETVILLYLPQYLEYLGFGLLFLTFAALFIKIKGSRKSQKEVVQ